MTDQVMPTALANYPLIRQGKVRDIYDLGDHLLLVATDRISAFDVVLPLPLPGKGALLTAISQFWFTTIRGLMPTQQSDVTLADLDLTSDELAYLKDRSVIARKAERVDIECVVRAFLAGSAWKEYQAGGTVAGVELPPGFQRGDRLPDVMFTPAVKNDSGHDENISIARLRELVGAALADELERESLKLFAIGSDVAAQAGFLLADSKFEFGWIDGELAVIDELFTPDSSRYWDAAMWQPGTEPPSFDKQIIRDWLETTGWNKLPPGPELPPEIVAQALERYAAVADRLLATGNKDEGMQQVDEGFWNLEVIVMPKAGVNDPQGDAVRSGLHSLGFDGTRNVRIGKRIRLEVAAGSEHEALALGREMCDRLLANPVIEEYTIRAIAEQVPV